MESVARLAKFKKVAAFAGTLAACAALTGFLSSCSSAKTAGTSPPVYHAYMSIVPGEYTNSPAGPAYIPADMTLPAHSTIVMTVTNFDTATPLTGASVMYSKVTGVLGGTESVTPISVADPNGSAGATVATPSVDPNDVAHTFTIAAYHLNVPIPAHSRVVFSFTTGGQGTVSWRCNDPCATGPTGWGGAMMMKGYMEGTIRVA